jgi:hypothetical protein
MELASMLAGEPFSDHPRTASPVIAAFLRVYNDGLDDERRQDLYPYAASTVDTRGEQLLESARADRCAAWAGEVHREVPFLRRWLGLRPKPLRRGQPVRPDEYGANAAHVALQLGSDAHPRVLAFVDELIAMGADQSPLTVPATEAIRPRPEQPLAPA